jgi:hypothetical protein
MVPQNGQVSGTPNSRSPAGPQVGHWAEHLGNYVADLAQDHHVAYERVLALELVRVVQGGPVHRGAAHLDGFHHCGRVTWPVRPTFTWMSSSLVVTSSGGYLNAMALPGRPAGRAELALQRDLVHLHHHAVDLIRPIMPVLGVAGGVPADPVHVGDDPVQAADRQAQPCSRSYQPD